MKFTLVSVTNRTNAISYLFKIHKAPKLAPIHPRLLRPAQIHGEFQFASEYFSGTLNDTSSPTEMVLCSRLQRIASSSLEINIFMVALRNV